MESVRRHLSSLVLAGLLVIVIFLLLGYPTKSAAAQGASGAEIYSTRCASCHQPLGQGIPGTFPPLTGNPSASDPDYVETVVREGRSGELEVLGVSYDTAMPAVVGLGDDEIAAVVDYVVELSGRSGDTGPSPSTTVAATPPNAAAGKSLFTGSDRFENGGASCSSCHTAGSVGNLGGSSLGPDLTDVHERLGGDAGLAAWLSNPPSQTMSPIFADRPLTDNERNHLTAFLSDAPAQEKPTSVDTMLLAGLAGVAVLLIGMAVAWRGMRQTYVSMLRSRR